MKRIICLTASLLLAGVAGPVSAQTTVRAGETINGTLDASSGSSKQGVRGNCYVLETTPGSQWQISMQASFDTFLQVGRGTECAAIDRWDVQKDDGWFGDLNANLSFTAGGGAYLVFARGYEASASGSYVLAVTEKPERATRGMLPAGPPPPPPPIVGTASTANVPSGDGPVPAPGQELKDCPQCPQLVVIPAGSFMMGSPASEADRIGNEGPRHLVTLARPFAMGKFEVSFDEWNACVTAGGCPRVSDNGWGEGRRPALVVHAEAQRYVAWLSRSTGKAYFLPSESEWEYAARAGTDTPWNTGEAILAEDANMLNQFGRTVPVGGFPPNAFGLHDTHGNVWEWVQDCFDVGYFGVPTDGGAVTSPTCAQRIARGGSYGNEPKEVRSAFRAPTNTNRVSTTGFRVARAL